MNYFTSKLKEFLKQSPYSVWTQSYELLSKPVVQSVGILVGTHILGWFYIGVVLVVASVGGGVVMTVASVVIRALNSEVAEVHPSQVANSTYSLFNLKFILNVFRWDPTWNPILAWMLIQEH